jgi:hypothetical protein
VTLHQRRTRRQVATLIRQSAVPVTVRELARWLGASECWVWMLVRDLESLGLVWWQRRKPARLSWTPPEWRIDSAVVAEGAEPSAGATPAARANSNARTAPSAATHHRRTP